MIQSKVKKGHIIIKIESLFYLVFYINSFHPMRNGGQHFIRNSLGVISKIF